MFANLANVAANPANAEKIESQLKSKVPEGLIKQGTDALETAVKSPTIAKVADATAAPAKTTAATTTAAPAAPATTTAAQPTPTQVKPPAKEAKTNAITVGTNIITRIYYEYDTYELNGEISFYVNILNIETKDKKYKFDVHGKISNIREEKYINSKSMKDISELYNLLSKYKKETNLDKFDKYIND